MGIQNGEGMKVSVNQEWELDCTPVMISQGDEPWRVTVYQTGTREKS